MNRPQLKLFTAAVAIFVLAVISGCDLQENADLDNGRELFVENCGSCHILSEAATAGNLGPDLDSAFAEARDAGMDQDTIEGVVGSQISYPRETDVDDPTYMPADLVTGDDARDVAAYVASVAGIPGIEPPVAPGGPGGQVYANNGCGACHILAAAESVGQVGPNLDEVLPGQSKAMIEESIVAPEARITEGFDGGVMPANYEQEIPPDELQLLVDFLAEAAGEGGGNGGGGNGGGGGGGGGGGN